MPYTRKYTRLYRGVWSKLRGRSTYLGTGGFIPLPKAQRASVDAVDLPFFSAFFYLLTLFPETLSREASAPTLKLEVSETLNREDLKPASYPSPRPSARQPTR